MSTLYGPDAFSYSVGALATVSGGVWANVMNTLRVSAGGVVIETSGGGEGMAKLASFSATGDQWAQCVVGGSAMQFQGPGVRMTAGGHGYFIEVNGTGTESRIIYYDGSYNTVATSTGGAGTFVAGDMAWLGVEDNALTAKKNGTAITGLIAALDNNISDGNPWIRLYGSGSDADRTIDTFEAGDFASEGISGTLSVTLADATLAATATVALQGSLTATLAAATLTATGTISDAQLPPPTWNYGDTLRLTSIRGAVPALISVTGRAPSVTQVEGS